jgi:cytosine/adenosine deaminase-related metal-dependent hydrolase
VKVRVIDESLTWLRRARAHLFSGRKHALSEDDTSLLPRDVLYMATMGGAIDLDLAECVGSLTPGKRADLILLDVDSLSAAPYVDACLGDPFDLAVYSCNPASVDTVIVDGCILKYRGALAALDLPRLLTTARRTLSSLVDRANDPPTNALQHAHR